MKNLKYNTLFIGFIGLILLLLSITLNPAAVSAGDATLSWDPPTTNEDGTSLTDLAGYKIYYGTTSGNYTSSIDVSDGTTCKVSNLTDGLTYYFAATAYDTLGNESGYSNEVSKLIGPSPAAEITVTNSVAPLEDLQVPFGDITEGISSPIETVTISNTGSADLYVSNIQLTGTDAEEFSLDVNGGASPCGVTTPTIEAGSSCTLAVTFSPTTTGLKSANLEIIPYNTDMEAVNVILSGTGISSVTNNPPSTPQLVYPANGQTGLDTTVEFRWENSTDPDRDTVTYNLYVCEDNEFTTDCITEENIIVSLNNKNIYYAGVGASGAGLLLFGIVFASSAKSRKKIGVLIAMIMIATILLVSCGGGGGESGSTPAGNTGYTTDAVYTTDEVSYTISGLDAGAPYYWKITAKDSYGGETASSVRSFITQ